MKVSKAQIDFKPPSAAVIEKNTLTAYFYGSM